MDSEAIGRVCGFHRAEAVGVCPRCGAFMCADCRQTGADWIRCQVCAFSEREREERVSRARSLARASWLAFVFMVAAAVVIIEFNPLIFPLVCLLLCTIGFSAGIAALLEGRRLGASGIRAPAVIGLVLNGLVVLPFLAALAGAVFH